VHLTRFVTHGLTPGSRFVNAFAKKSSEKPNEKKVETYMVVMMLAMLLAGGFSMMNHHEGSHSKVPTGVFDVRYQVCPVKGGTPKNSVAVLRRNRVYHFCSQDCLETFKRTPRPFLRKISSAREVPLRTTNPDGKDPVSAHPIEARKNPPFLVRGDTITFFSSKVTRDRA